MTQYLIPVEGQEPSTAPEMKEATAAEFAAYQEKMRANKAALLKTALEKSQEKAAAVAEIQTLLESEALAVAYEKSLLSGKTLAVADYGFVNLHTSDNLDGRGDGVWYPFTSAKTRHKGDTIMSRGDATAQGIKIGS